MSQHNRISTLINSQVPFFVRNDHEQFVKFLEKYYEYLEQDEKVVSRLKTIRDLNNIDLAPDEFAEHLYDTFMRYIPKEIEVDKRLLLKHIKDFYRAKGTEKSIRFLLNALFHAKASFYYPKLDVLRASDGKWYIQRSLRVTGTRINGQANNTIAGLENYVRTRVRGVTSNANATVERVERIFERGAQIDEIILSNIDGEFESGESIISLFDDVQGTSNITSNIFSGVINSITVEDGGTNYFVGDPVVIVSSVGQGAVASVAAITTGDIVSIAVLQGGAGYRVNDNVLVVATGTGLGAAARINQVIDDERYHANTYNISYTTIDMIANVFINSANWGANANFGNANSSIANIQNYWTYANTGPAGTIFVVNPGSNYDSPPAISIIANTQILQLGILGRMEIRNGGQDYEIGDEIQFVNLPGCLGTGARAEVTNVDTSSSNTITEVRFVEQPGHIIGGSGYTMDALPGALVLSNTGTGANIAVTAILGSGSSLRADQSTIGTITRIVVTSRGSGYDSNTTIDLTQSGSGDAVANASILEGVITYPGRWLNDDGQLSSYNFLQDRDFYQNFSYVIRSKESIAKYRKVLENLVHPAGTKMFGEYLYENIANNTFDEAISSDSSVRTGYLATYETANTTINLAVSEDTYDLSTSYGNVTISFETGILASNVETLAIDDSGEDNGSWYITVTGNSYPDATGTADLFFID